MVYRLPPALSRLPVPSRATRSTFPSRPYRFPVSLRAICPTFPPRPCHFPASSRAVRPMLPFVHAVSRWVVRYSFGVSSRPSVPFCPVSRFLRSPFFLSFFRRFCSLYSANILVLLYSANNFALRRFARQTVILGFGLTHLFCVCVCTLSSLIWLKRMKNQMLPVKIFLEIG